MSRLSCITTAAERTLLVLVTALVLALHSGGIAAHTFGAPSFVPVTFLLEILPTVQIVLLGAWAALGPGRIWLRVPAAIGLAFLWGTVWIDPAWWRLSTADWTRWMSKAGLIACLAAVAVRCCGFRAQFSRGAFQQSGKVQFSLRALIVLTTIIAATLGVLEWLRPMLALRYEWELDSGVMVQTWWQRWFSSPDSLREWVMASAVAAAGLAAVFSTLHRGWVWPRMLIVLTLSAVTGAYLANLSGGGAEGAFALSLTMALLATTAGISVLPLRLAQVRLSRACRARLAATAPAKVLKPAHACPAPATELIS